MGLDERQLNEIYSQLKDLVGDKGAFVIFLTTPKKDSAGEEIRFETFGQVTTLNGLLGLGTQCLSRALQRRTDGIMSESVGSPISWR